jgi:hypothetical protein
MVGNIWIDTLCGTLSVLCAQSEPGHRDGQGYGPKIQGGQNRRTQQGDELHLVHVRRPHAARFAFLHKSREHVI